MQSPLPLLIGGGGEKVTLKITAKYADEWNVWGTVETLRHKMAILDQHCADVGRDPKSIKRTAVALLFMSEDNGFLEKMRNAELQQAAIIGTPAEVKEIVADYEAAGVDELIVPGLHARPERAEDRNAGYLHKRGGRSLIGRRFQLPNRQFREHTCLISRQQYPPPPS